MKKKILISTGGTGGHVIPANVFFEHLKNDFEVFITSDQRGIKFLYEKTENIKIINMPKLKKNIYNLPLNFILIIFLTVKSILFIKKEKYKYSYIYRWLYVITTMYFSKDFKFKNIFI